MFRNSIHSQPEPAPSLNSAQLHLESHFSDWSSDAEADAGSVGPAAPKRTRIRGRNNIYEHASFRGAVDYYPETNPAVTRNITRYHDDFTEPTRHHDDLIETVRARDNHIIDTLVTTENKPRMFICNGVLSETEVDAESVRFFDTDNIPQEKLITKKLFILGLCPLFITIPWILGAGMLCGFPRKDRRWADARYWAWLCVAALAAVVVVGGMVLVFFHEDLEHKVVGRALEG